MWHYLSFLLQMNLTHHNQFFLYLLGNTPRRDRSHTVHTRLWTLVSHLEPPHYNKVETKEGHKALNKFGKKAKSIIHLPNIYECRNACSECEIKLGWYVLLCNRRVRQVRY